MRSIVNKLNSRRGSSLFIAIIFFLLCFFVGGTVLAAATSNAGRIASMKASREDYYKQRSAAIFVQDQFSEPGRLTISLVTDTVLEVTPDTESGYTEISTVTNMSTIEASADQTALQQLISLAVARQFYDHNTEEKNIYTNTLSFVGFDKVMESSLLSGYLLDSCNTPTGTIDVSGEAGFGNFSAQYSSAFDANEDFGDLTINIHTEGTEDLFSVSVPANVSITESVGGTTETVGTSVRMNRKETMTVTVIWGEASIRKGATA